MISPGRAEQRVRRRSLVAMIRAGWLALDLTRDGLSIEVPRRWAIGAPMAVVALIVAGALVEPAPATEATGGAAVLEATIAYVFMGGMLATVLGAASQKRWGIAAGLGLAVFTVGLAVTCPVSGHHTFGLWFAGQSACVLAATGVATAGLLKTKR